MTQAGNPVFDALESRARRRGPEPVLAFAYADGLRTELSATTALNAVCKAANLLREEAGIEPGMPLSLTIPWHWQRLPWLVAALALGADVSFAPGAPVEVGSTASLAASPARDRLAVSLHPFGLPIADLPSGMVDASAEARLQPDAFWAEPVGEPALLAEARAAYAFDAGTRVLAAGDQGWMPLLLPLVTDAALVMAEAAEDAERTAQAESASARI